MWLTNSSIGRKLVMSLTGAFLVLFVTFHVLMNAVAIFWPSAYNVVCEFLGANWYALIGSAILAAGFLLHIVYAIWLTIQNRNARGNDRYAVTSKPAQVEWSSQNMLVLGFVVIAFLAIHLIQFWAKMQLAEIAPCCAAVMQTPCGHEIPVPPAAGTLFLQMAFSQAWTLPVYLIGLVALWFHMTHGFWSMFQSCGWNGQIWIDRLKCIANWWTTIVVGLFMIQAVWFTIQANDEAYVKCPELQGQYIEMMQKHAMKELPPCDGCHKGECADKAECCKAEGQCCKAEGQCQKAEGECCGKCTEGKCDGNCGHGDCAQCPKAGTEECCKNAQSEETNSENQ